QVTFSRDWSP
uniref:Hypertrehalosaemic hormone n=1 Tax=Locusta migratoria TaxID=7004 RepID=HTF_LOCMI|nr:RecName: Full=Hypertrehalosaemic hormone; Short=Lom-HrTH; AltName: Full=Hypertrehalosaemic neuropeptide; AltName: Full=Peptide hormone [Locusta migratoria]